LDYLYGNVDSAQSGALIVARTSVHAAGDWTYAEHAKLTSGDPLEVAGGVLDVGMTVSMLIPGAGEGEAAVGLAVREGGGLLVKEGSQLIAREGAQLVEKEGAGLAESLAERCAVNSFTAATPVLMADGKRKPISQVKVGDLVLAGDAQKGTVQAEPVQQVIEGKGLKHIIEIRAGPETIEATYNHPFWLANRGTFEWADHLQVGDKLLEPDGSQLPITAISRHDEVTTVYNLSIANVHTFYVGDQAVLVHNSCSPGLERIFSEGAGGSVRGRSIIEVRSTLLEEGFTMGEAHGSGYLFENSLGEQVRIMSRGGGWDLRAMNGYGNYLDEFGNVARDAASAHGINVFSY
jgi:hypothetical protein